MLLKGQVAVVTGATQGIGLAIARTLVAEGCDLAICGRDAARLKKAEIELKQKKVRIIAKTCDVSDEASVSELFTLVHKTLRRIDILVNSAGVAHSFQPVAKLSTEEWNNVIATNLTGMFLVTKAALPLMKRGATIANLLSMSARRAFPNLAAYNASKFGGLGFTNTLREELREQGIRVVAVMPGATDTPIWDTLWPDAPRRKMIRPETVAQAVVDALKLPRESTVEEIVLMPTTGAL